MLSGLITCNVMLLSCNYCIYIEPVKGRNKHGASAVTSHTPTSVEIKGGMYMLKGFSGLQCLYTLEL